MAETCSCLLLIDKVLLGIPVYIHIYLHPATSYSPGPYQSTPRPSILVRKIHFNIILSSKPTDFKWSPQGISLLTHPCYMASHFHLVYLHFTALILGGRSWDSSVGITTGYGLDGPGIESR